MAVHRQACVEHDRRAAQQQAHGQDGPDADTGDEPLRDRRDEHDRQRQRDVGETRLERRVVQDLLHVEGEQEELREERSGDEQ